MPKLINRLTRSIRRLALRTKPKKFQHVIVDFELIGLVQLLLQLMHWARINGNRPTALQARQMMPIFLHQTVERLATAHRPRLHHPFQLQRLQRPIYRRQPHRLIAISQFNEQILRGNRAIEVFEDADNPFLATGTTGFHEEER